VKDKLFGRFRLSRPGFTLDAELHVPSRGITGLFGDSGCGKTTLLRCLAGLERAEEGVLRVNGKVWQDESAGIFLRPYERPIGMVFQEARLFPHINIEQNLLYGVKRKRGLNGRPDEFDYTLDLLGIEHLLQRKPERLSGGELQRVAIGRALLTKPELLLMDEPLAALDNRRKREIMPYLDRLHGELEIPIIYVSHSPEEMLHLADRLVHLDGGRTTEIGDVVEVLTRITSGSSQFVSENQFDAVVEMLDLDTHLLVVDSPFGRLSLPANGAQHGEQLRLRIAAGDILLSNEPLSGFAMLNVLSGEVVSVSAPQQGHVYVSLSVAGQQLKVRINHKCFMQQPFEVGQNVYAGLNKAYIEQRLVLHSSIQE